MAVVVSDPSLPEPVGNGQVPLSVRHQHAIANDQSALSRRIDYGIAVLPNRLLPRTTFLLWMGQRIGCSIHRTAPTQEPNQQGSGNGSK